MVWTHPMTFVDGRPLTSAQLNAQIRDNLMETEVAKAVTGGGYFTTVSPHSIIQRKARKASIITSEDTTETGFTDLTTPGPSVTCQTGNVALIIVSCRLSNSSSTAFSMASVGITGTDTNTGEESTSIEPSDHRCLFAQGDGVGASTFWVEDQLTPGTNTFSMRYRVSGGTGTFTRRRITVLPL